MAFPRRQSHITIAVAIVAAIVATGTWFILAANKPPQVTGRTNPGVSGPPPVKEVEYTIESVVGGLAVPWDIVFTSRTRWLVSERAGSLRVVEGGKLRPEPLVRFPQVSSTSEEGLMGLALDPGYASNRLVYACYATPAGSALIDRVVKFRDEGASAGPVTTVIDSLPAARNHAGCRLGFGPDGKLYITTGDATNRAIAQQKNSLGGKILRVNADGSVPADNPFKGSPIWSLGHRNPQGLAWQPDTGSLFATEHGPSGFDGPGGGDEVNIIRKGGNYGWPEVSHERTDPRYASPLLVFTPAVAPSGMTFYNGDALPQFKGNLFFTGLRGQGLYRVIMSADDPAKVFSYSKMADVNAGRIRDVAQGPDEALYFMTSNRDGRGTPAEADDRIFRIRPAGQ